MSALARLTTFVAPGWLQSYLTLKHIIQPPHDTGPCTVDTTFSQTPTLPASSPLLNSPSSLNSPCSLTGKPTLNICPFRQGVSQIHVGLRSPLFLHGSTRSNNILSSVPQGNPAISTFPVPLYQPPTFYSVLPFTPWPRRRSLSFAYFRLRR